ncbi:MAG: hypothetical protein ABSA39_17825 [Edaphobacter sp.]
MSKLKAIVGWTGTALFAVSLASAQWYLSSTPPRPSLPLRTMVGCIIAAVICGLIWFFLTSEGSEEPGQPERPASAQAIDTGGGDNSGSQFHVQGDLYYHADQSAPAPATSAPATETKTAVSSELAQQLPVRTTANLQFRRTWELLIYDYMQRGWRIALAHEPGACNGIVLWVENVFPVQGLAKDIYGLFASIRAEQFDSLSISRAYWLKQADNQVELRSGGKLGVVVGYFPDSQTFVSHSNPHSASFQNPFDDGYRPLSDAARMELILREAESRPLTIHVTLAQMPNQAIIDCKKLTIILPQRIMDMGDCTA